MIDLKDEYLLNFRKAADLILNNNSFRIFSHYDADGISSAIIISETLRRLKKEFHLTFLKSFNINAIKESDSNVLILSDLGADGINEFNNSSTILVDHHTAPSSEADKIINLNPRSYGYDGSREACSSSVAFLLSISVEETNSDLFPYFVSGAIGDKQDVGGYYGINSRINESYGKKYKSRKDLNLDGESVMEGIYYSTDPYFFGLSGDKDATISFLKKLDIDPDLALHEINDNMRTRLADSLMLKLLSANTSDEGYDSLVTNRYFFDEIGISDHLLSSYIDYSGREDQMGLPVSWVMGNEDALDSMKGIWYSFKEELLDEIKNAINDIKEMTNIQYFHVKSQSMAGTAAGICMLYIFDKRKPTIALYKNKAIKISSRATWDLVRKGVDLSKAVNKSCLAVGGHGGGHNIAAGGEIPYDKEDEFLKILNDEIGGQLGNT